MNARDLQNRLRDILEELIEASNDDADDSVADLAERVENLCRISTYGEASILTTDKGLVVECDDGREFQITIARSR